jgi:hypothetical protein
MESTPNSVTRTLRVDKDLDRAIAAVAAKERVSVNFLVNRCIRRYVEWDYPSAEFGMVSVPNLLWEELTKDKDGSALEQLGRKVAQEYLRPAALYLTGEFTAASATEVLRRASLYGGTFSFNVDEGQDTHNRVIVLRHDQGSLWSRYFVGLLDETYGVLLQRQIKMTYTGSLCVVQMTAG